MARNEENRDTLHDAEVIGEGVHACDLKDPTLVEWFARLCVQLSFDKDRLTGFAQDGITEVSGPCSSPSECKLSDSCARQCITAQLLLHKDEAGVARNCVLALTNLLCDGGANATQMVKAGGIKALHGALLVCPHRATPVGLTV